MSDGFDGRVQAALRQCAARISAPDDPLADVHRRARRQRRVRAAGLTVVVVAVLGAGAATVPQLDQPDVALAPPSPAGSPSPTPSDTPAGFPSETATCRGRERGVAFVVDYPGSWWASDGTDAEPCRWFHPEPLGMPSEAADVPGAAIHLRVADTPFRELRRIDTGRDEVLLESETTVSGRRALVQEYVSNADAAYPPGTRMYRFLVDVDGRTLSGTTTSASSADYGESRAVLDAMLTSLQLEVGATAHDDQPSCSAARADLSPKPQDGLPDAVAEARTMIFEAAASCAYDGLAEIAGEDFTYSFGGGGDFAGFLRRGEESPPRPLRYLVELLQRPYGTVEVQGRTQYVWPAAFAYDGWSDVPAADREALKPLYDEQDFASFAQFGGYTGYRVGIDADGEWRFFVAGD